MALITDAAPGSSYWQAAINLATSASKCGRPLTALVSQASAAEALKPFCDTIDIANETTTKLQPSREFAVAYDKLLDALERASTGAEATSSQINARALVLAATRLTFPMAIDTMGLRAFATCERVRAWLIDRHIGSIIVLPHWSRLAWAAINCAKPLGLRSASSPSVTVAGSSASLVEWQKLDLIGCYGEQCRVAFASVGYPSEKLAMIGSVSLDHALLMSRKAVRDSAPSFRKIASSAERIILFATSGVNHNERDIVREIVTMCARPNSKTALVIRPHPSLGRQFYEEQLTGVATEVASVVTDTTVHEALIAADVVITDFSTVGADAVLVKRPLLVINTTGGPFPSNNYADLGVAVEARKLEDVVPHLQRLLDAGNDWPGAAAKIKAFTHAYNWGGDGLASLRLIERLQLLAPATATDVAYRQNQDPGTNRSGFSESGTGHDDDQPATVFVVDPQIFYPRDPALAGLRHRQRGMEQLTKRYQLTGKSVISLSAHRGFAEYWLHRAGCQLVLVDADRHNAIRPRLRAIDSNTTAMGAAHPLTYMIATPEQAKKSLRHEVDVCLIHDTGQDSSANGPGRSSQSNHKPEEKISISTSAASGAATVDVFSNAALALARAAVCEGGLLIQSMLSRNLSTDGAGPKAYLEAAQAQLKASGFHLVEIQYAVDDPAMHILVSVRGSGQDADRMREQLKTRASINEYSFTGAPPHYLVAGQGADADARFFAAHAQQETTPSRVFAQHWRAALEMTGRSVTQAIVPLDQTLARFALAPCQQALCLGDRAELIACAAYQRNIPVTFRWDTVTPHSAIPQLTKTLLRSARVPALMAGTTIEGQQGQFDLIVIAGQDLEDRRRTTDLRRWYKALETNHQDVESVPAFFDPKLLAMLKRCLRPDGLLVIEGNSGGFDLRRVPSVIERLVLELRGVGITALELRCVKAAPALIHLVAVRCDLDAGGRLLSAMQSQHDITNAHTYIELDSATELFWSATVPVSMQLPMGRRERRNRWLRQWRLQPGQRTAEAKSKALELAALAKEAEFARNFAIRWRKALEAAGHPVDKLLKPLEQALQRFAVDQPRNSACIGPRAELASSYLFQRGAAVTFVPQSVTVDTAVSRLATDGIPRAPQITIAADSRKAAESAPFDCIVALGSEKDEEARASRMLPWLSNSDISGATMVAAEHPPEFLAQDFVAFLDGSLAPGGLLVLECRTGGLDLRHAPKVFSSLQAQLQSVGISAIELYCVTTAPGLILLIAGRYDAAAAKSMAIESAKRSSITDAHPYIELDSAAELIWTAANDHPPRPNLQPWADFSGRLRSLANRWRGSTGNRNQSGRPLG